MLSCPCHDFLIISLAEYWVGVSETAKDFVNACLTTDPATRPTAADALEHKWLASDQPHFVPDPESPSGGPTNLLPNIQRVFNARMTCEPLNLL